MIGLQAGPTARALLNIAGWAGCALLGVLLSPEFARAYSTPEVFREAANLGGGGGRWFTGSPAEGYDCSVCHSPAPGQRTYPFYISGLPALTYDLSTTQEPVTQELVVSWPEFAAAFGPLKAAVEAGTAPPGVDIPVMGLVLEFVAESGAASGTIELDTAPGRVLASELCEQKAANIQPQLGAKLFRVRPGLKSEVVRPDDDGVLRCEASQLGQRCLIAMRSCGASQVRFRWTTPTAWQGPIWFSAGFVATESLSGSFDRDSVFTLSLPLLPADEAAQTDGRYVRTLGGGCALAGPGRAGLGWLMLSALSLAFLARRVGRGGRS